MCLKQTCNHLRSLPKEVLDPACHVLSTILAKDFHKHFACTVQDVIEVVSKSDHPLPIQAERLCDLLEALSARTKKLFLRNYDAPKWSWIVLDIYALLHNINGKIFAPKGFTENVFKPTNHGILPWSQLSSEFPDLDPSLIVAFLGRLEFCQVISDLEVLNLIEGQSPTSSESDISQDSPTCISPFSDGTISERDCLEKKWPVSSVSLDNVDLTRHCTSKIAQSVYCSLSHPYDPHDQCPESCPILNGSTGLLVDKLEKYLFFPGLISPEQPKKDMWTKDEFGFYSGWCLKCIKDQQFFSLRFLHTLLLRLSLSFGVTKSSNGLCEQAEFTIWKNGLRWLNLDGIETIVEVVEDRKAVLLLMRMKERSILKGLQLRAAIIKKILDTKKEYCMQIVTSESFIDPSHLQERHSYPVINRPLDEIRRYDITLLAVAFCTNSKLMLKHALFRVPPLGNKSCGCCT